MLFVWRTSAAQTIREEEMAILRMMFKEEELVIVSSTNCLQHLKKAPSVASVITEEQIRNMGARDLLDVLKTVPGIGVSMATGYGMYGIESRGITSVDSEKVLFMIDGHRLNNALSGGATSVFADMNVEKIKRVEIIRGPGSALHGANAFAGSINIVTKDAGDIDGADFRAGGGGFQARHYSLLAGKEFPGLKVSGSFDYLDTNGPRLFVEKDSIGRSGRTGDWKERYDAGLKMSYGNLSFHGGYTDRKRGPYIGILNALNDESKVENSHLFGELAYKHDFTGDFCLLWKGYYDRISHYAYWEGLPEGALPGFPDGYLGSPEAKNRALGTELRLDYSVWDQNTMTAGALHEAINQYDSRYSVNFNPNTNAPLGPLQDVSSWANWIQDRRRNVTALYLQDVWRFTNDIEGTLGVRYDHYSDFGDTVNPRAGLVWNFLEKANLKLLYGSAFRAPNFKELYLANNPVQAGNPDIDPEKVRTFETSVGYDFSKCFQANINYFHNDIADSIVLKNTLFQNNGGTTVDGIEAELKVLFTDSNYGYANYTWQSPRLDGMEGRVPYVPAHKGNIGVNLGLSKYLNVNSNLLMAGPRPYPQADRRSDAAGYEVLDLTLVAKNFHRGLEFRASVYNLLDEKYSDPDVTGAYMEGLPREGTSFIFEARYKF